MPHNVGRARWIPRGIDAVRFVSFSTHADVVIDGDVAAERQGPIDELYVLEDRQGDNGANVNCAA